MNEEAGRGGDAGHLEAWLAALQRDAGPSVFYAPIGSADRVFGLLAFRARPGCVLSEHDAATAQTAAEIFAAGFLRRAVEISLARAKEDALAASVTKGTFLAKMSHELRTPLNGVIGMVDLLAATPLDSRQRRYTEVVQTSAHLLLSVIHDILDFSKIEAGKLELEHVEFSLATVLEDVISILALSAERKGIDLACDTSHISAERLLGDAKRVHQVLINLIGNAVKYTNRGNVRVEVDVTPRPDQLSDVRVEVHDTGAGIPLDVRARLFQPFSTHGPGGTGLGLAICRDLVERMGGRIGLDSTEGNGSVFWFEVTFARAAPVTEPVRNPAGHEERGPSSGIAGSGSETVDPPRGRILVVEDSLVNIEVASEMLRLARYDVDVATDGLQALRCLRTQRFDLVLMDCQLPELDGYEATVKIRTLEAAGQLAHCPGTRLPVVALTGNATIADLERSRIVGMDAYLAKPVEMDRLLAVVAAQLARAKSPPPIDSLDTVLARLRGNHELLSRLIDQFVIDAAETRCRLREAYDARDPRALRQCTHRLRSQAATFEATALVHATEKLEEITHHEARAVWAVAGTALLSVDVELDRLLAYLVTNAGDVANIRASRVAS